MSEPTNPMPASPPVSSDAGESSVPTPALDGPAIRRRLGGSLGRAVEVEAEEISAAPETPGELLVAVSRSELGRALAELLALGARHLMLVALEPTGAGYSPLHERVALEEILAIPGGPIVRLRVDLPAADPSYPSITPTVPAAQWDEREAHDLFGIVPAGHPDPRPLVLHNPAAAPTGTPTAPGAMGAPPVAPFRSFVAHGDGVYQLPVGPIHAGIIEPGHFRFSAVGESVLHLDARLFYTHRGLEKLVEGRTFAEALPIVERACGVCTVTHATAYSQAVERLTGTTIPPRARAGRVLLAEMERLYNHVGDLGNMCAGVGFNFGMSRLGWQKERLLRLNESLTGHRYLMGMVAPGGLRLDIHELGLVDLAAAVTDVAHEVRSIVRLLVRSDSFMTRLHGTGVLRRSEALRLGAVGVAARASGLPGDLRRDRPVDGYRDLQISEIGAATGDAAARFHVRAQEAAASAEIIAELATGLPSGPLSVELARRPAIGAVALAGAEGPRGASWLWLMAGPEGRVTRLHLRSASFANWPVLASVVPGNLVPDFPLINKSFELCYACTDR